MYDFSLNTCDKTAKASDDYTARKDYVVDFAADQTSQDVVVNIVDDKVLEEVETFCAKLSPKDPKVSKIFPVEAVISIVDNDGKENATIYLLLKICGNPI